MEHPDWWAPWAPDENYRLWRGSRPLLISLPHDGSEIPPAIAEKMTEAARMAPDTDWHVGQLYDFARASGYSVLRPRWSRYVVDLNRPPDGAALYPGKSETGLCPTSTFASESIYRTGQEPQAPEIQARVERYWRPYHAALAGAVAEMRTQSDQVLLWEGHSIVGTCPLFFAGRLPDYNLGTADGGSCSPELQSVLEACLRQANVDHAVNGRFKGGYITRRHGQPASGVHAVQMELAQSNYMDEGAPFNYRSDRAEGVQQVLRGLLEPALTVIES